MTLRWPWIAAFAVFVVCIPLFAWNHHFYCDWPNHLGMIGYVGEYLKAHGTLPATFNTNPLIGRPTPVFYGNLYLPALGAVSALTGPRAALTLVVVALLFLQFASVRLLFRDATRDEAIACAAAVIVTWAIYPLTDLYNRAAITEFVAITALQAGSCLWTYYARDPAGRGHAGLGAGLLVTVAAGVHPPTALFGGLTFAVLWLASLIWCPDRRRLLVRSLAIAVAAVGVLAPWLYVLGKFGEQLNIVRSNGPLTFFPKSLDAVETRLSLVPTVGPDPTGMGTPNLDPQISVPLGAALFLFATVALAVRARDRVARRAFAFAALCAAATGVLFALSVFTAAWTTLPKSFTIIQFPYRLTAFVNVAALGALTGVLAVLVRAPRHCTWSRLVLAAGVVVASVGVGLKVPRCLEGGSGADAVVTDYANPPRDWYFGAEDYTTPEVFQKVNPGAPRQTVALAVGGASGFGRVGSTPVQVYARAQITTNVQAFPWNVLTIDGHAVPQEATLDDGHKLAAWIDPGEHTVGYEFQPDRTWSALRATSLALLSLWACGAAFGPERVRRAARWALARARRLRRRASREARFRARTRGTSASDRPGAEHHAHDHSQTR